jgi:glutamine---fructose-6-phosphate transaminase (isomerizing)
MCGIIGIIGKKEVAPLLLKGLRHLEYRGYDSAGIATVHDGNLFCSRATGKLNELDKELAKNPLSGTVGIGHTRWATHGSPTTTNAHPHITDKVGVIHNGIIENFKTLRDELEKLGFRFQTETDTEVIPLMIHHFLDQGNTPHAAVRKTLRKLEGAYALGILPLAIGYGNGEMYLASDAYALAPLTSQVSYLHEGDLAELRRASVIIYDQDDKVVAREIKPTLLSGDSMGKGDYPHFMLKEIYEQPSVVGQTLNSFYNPLTKHIHLPKLPFSLKKIERITIIACGTSYYAGLVAKYWLESIAKIPTEVDIASEFRYSDKLLHKENLAIFISQSGETADTLAALRYARTHGQHILSIINAQESSMERESDIVLHTLAGPEIGVASTKAFTTQLIALACFTLHAATARRTITEKQLTHLSYALSEIPSRMVEVLNHDDALKKMAYEMSKASDIFYIGRGTSYPIALEGALKLKEISYIHAEGIAAGELKHGSIALIDNNVPVIVIAPYDKLFEKTASNVQEVAARGGKVIFLSDAEGISHLEHISAKTITMPTIDPFVAPILYAIPIQLLAYHTAVLLGTDIDQPRNLAKSVTVE